MFIIKKMPVMILNIATDCWKTEHTHSELESLLAELNEDIFHDAERRDRDTMFLSHGSHLVHEWDQN